MVSLTCLLDRTSLMSLLFLPLLDETKMAHNDSVFVFVRKTSNDSCGRSNLTIDMNQVTNLKSLGFAWKNIINILEVTTHFWSLYFCNRFVVEDVVKLVFLSVVVEADGSPAPTFEALCFHLHSLHLLYWGTVFLTLFD